MNILLPRKCNSGSTGRGVHVWRRRQEDLHATADVTTLSTTTHADGLGGHLLSLTLRIVSCEIRIVGKGDDVRVARQRRGKHLGRAAPFAGIEAGKLLGQAF
jgi:hypothetical protein